MQRLTTVLTTALVAAGAGFAHADEVGGAVSTDSSAAMKDDGFVLPKGKLLLNVFLPIDLSTDAVGKPIDLSPDIWYGATDDLSVGLVHSGEGETGFIGSSLGRSLCLTGSDNGCAHFYNNIGLDGRYRLMKPLALDVGLYINSISDPFQLDLKIGLDGRWLFANGKASLEAQPSLLIGLTNRSVKDAMGNDVPSASNSEFLYVPLTGAYEVAPKLAIALQLGLVLPFTAPGDTWAIPISIAARYAATPQLGLGLAFTFPDAIGGNSTADERDLTLGGTYAF
ncbi:MAG: hypothetical protein QM831_14560 [Kofleriaceae bacterium]